jgi:hypothetical protein
VAGLRKSCVAVLDFNLNLGLELELKLLCYTTLTPTDIAEGPTERDASKPK